MKAIICAAGRGVRLGANSPKILLEFGGRTLLEWHALRLRGVGVNDVVLVTGHLREQVASVLPDIGARHGLKLRELVNERFHEGSVLSLAAALPEIEGSSDPILLMDADVLYPAQMLERLIHSTHPTALLLDREYSTKDDDPVLVPVKSSRPFEFQKKWTGAADFVGESVGFFKIGPNDLPMLINETRARSNGPEVRDSYDDVLRAMVLADRFGYEDATGLPWTEIDFPDDVVRARDQILPQIEHWQVTPQRRGGLQTAPKRRERRRSMITPDAALQESLAGQQVLVTGASGFIGWHVADQLVQAGARVRALVRPATPRDKEAFEWFEGDLLRRDSLDAAVKDCRYVFHVAGDYRFWARDPKEIFANNVQGTINVLEAAMAAGVDKIVYTSTTGILEKGTEERLATEARLASPATFTGPYKRSKFEAFLEAQKRAEAGWPIVTALPTAPIGPHDLKPTPTGMIIVQFLNGRIPMLARTGLNFADVRQCARGHLLALTRGRPGERYLLGGTNLWLGQFLQLLEPFGKHRAPRAHAPHWLSYATACVSEAAAKFSKNWQPFVTRESVRMSRGPHFSSNEKAERELGYEAIPIDDAIRDAVQDFAARGMVPRPA